MTALLRIPQVEQRLGIKRTAIYERIKHGTLPAPIKYGARTSIWPSGEIEQCCAAIIRGASDADMRQLVHDLTEKRAA